MLDTYHSDYNKSDDDICNSGFTFKNKMIENFKKFQEMSICFRINMDFSTNLNDYTPILELLAHGIGNTNVTKRTLDFRIGYAMKQQPHKYFK